TASTSDDGRQVLFNISPDTGDLIRVDVTIRQGEKVVGDATLTIRPTEVSAGGKYTGNRISLNVQDADLREVINLFGKLTNLEMKIDENVQGKVTVNWRDIPWDKAFEVLMNENGCAYRIDGKTVYVTKK